MAEIGGALVCLTLASSPSIYNLQGRRMDCGISSRNSWTGGETALMGCPVLELWVTRYKHPDKFFP